MTTLARTFALPLLCASALTLSTIVACDGGDDNGSDGSSDSDGDDDDDGGNDGSYLSIGKWEEVANADFVDIKKLTIGSYGDSENFLNRGNIEVNFTTDGTIKVEIQKVIVAESEKRAEEVAERFAYWGYAVDTPKKPSDIDEPETVICADDQWLDGCNIQAYYDGQTQAGGTAMNIRVSLPKGWPGALYLRTDDNTEDEKNYPARGNVTVNGFVGGVDVTAASGVVRLNRDGSASAAVNCSDDDLQTCEDVGWDLDNGCKCSDFSTVKVEMRQSGNVFVNLNSPDIIGSVDSAFNKDPTLQPSSPIVCIADVECDGFDWCDKNSEFDWKVTKADLNTADLVNTAAGISINISSARCQNINYVEGESDFGEPKSEDRGFLYICADDSGACKE